MGSNLRNSDSQKTFIFSVWNSLPNFGFCRNLQATLKVPSLYVGVLLSLGVTLSLTKWVIT
jgi:hypothetical protein